MAVPGVLIAASESEWRANVSSMAVPRPGGWRLCAAFVYDIRHGMPIGSIIMTPQTVQDMGHGQNVFLWVGPHPCCPTYIVDMCYHSCDKISHK